MTGNKRILKVPELVINNTFTELMSQLLISVLFVNEQEHSDCDLVF